MLKITDNDKKILKILYDLDKPQTKESLEKKSKLNTTSLNFSIYRLRDNGLLLLENKLRKGSPGQPTKIISITKSGEYMVKAITISEKHD